MVPKKGNTENFSGNAARWEVETKPGRGAKQLIGNARTLIFTTNTGVYIQKPGEVTEVDFTGTCPESKSDVTASLVDKLIVAILGTLTA
jgi:hypothetical protein